MSSKESSLTEQNRALRLELGAQRERLAQQLTNTRHDVDAHYPRSATMRWLLKEPKLVARLVARVAGARLARSIPVLFLAARFLHSNLAR